MHINDKLRRAVLVGQLRKYRRRITTVGICMLELGRGRGVWLGRARTRSSFSASGAAFSFRLRSNALANGLSDGLPGEG